MQKIVSNLGTIENEIDGSIKERMIFKAKCRDPNVTITISAQRKSNRKLVQTKVKTWSVDQIIEIVEYRHSKAEWKKKEIIETCTITKTKADNHG